MEFWDMAVRMVSSLAGVLALMLVLAAIAKRLFGARLPMGAGQSLVRVVGSGYLAPRKSVSLVAVAGELLIVGTTQDDIVPLGRVTDPECIKQVMSGRTQQDGASEDTFWASWRRTMNGSGNEPSQSGEKGGHAR